MVLQLSAIGASSHKENAVTPLPKPSTPPRIPYCIDQLAFRIQGAVSNTLLPALARVIAEYVNPQLFVFSLSNQLSSQLSSTCKIEMVKDLQGGQLRFSWDQYQNIFGLLKREKKDQLNEQLVDALFINFKTLMAEPNKSREQLAIISDARVIFQIQASHKTLGFFEKAFHAILDEIERDRQKQINEELEDMGLIPGKDDKGCCSIS